jgi:hypothetical protein
VSTWQRRLEPCSRSRRLCQHIFPKVQAIPPSKKMTMNAVRDRNWRKLITGAFLVFLLVASLTAQNTWTSSISSIAYADNCITQDAEWHLQAGDVRVSYGRSHFGANICMRDGRITSASAFLYGGVEGAGASAGFVWDAQGSWVPNRTNTYVEFRARAKMKLCVAGRYTPVCSLTETQEYYGRFTSTAGPYPRGRENRIWATGSWCSATGCHSGDLRRRVR